MAEVFEAEIAGELGFVRKVAIKRMLPDAAADPGAARRFLDEARIASKLHHANIVAVTDVGLLDGLPFQVLELVDGLNAQQLQQRAGGMLPLDIALIISADVAHALDHAHRATDDAGVPLGFVHRDVKPSNVLVSWAGDVKLADFGIALARDRSARTETGIVAGTLGFIAPEQRTRSEVDGRADVFALGLTLHALLVGYTPLRDVSAEIALLEGAPVPLDPAIPADVCAVIARAIAPQRVDRPSAAELAGMLGALLARELARTGSDARSRMRGFLASLDNAADRKPRAGALDQLLGIEVVPAGSDGAVSEYRTVAARPPPPRDVAAPSHDAPPSLPPSPRRRLLPFALAAGALAAFGVATWLVVARSSGGDAMPDAGVLAAGDVTRGAMLGAMSDASDVAMPGATADAAIAVATDARVDAGRAVVAKRPKPPVVTRPPPRDEPAAVETGWLQVVGGEELVGARVIVDGGRWKFSVPHKHEVAVGSHRVEVVKPDGTKLPAKTIEVTTFHTLRNAAKVTY